MFTPVAHYFSPTTVRGTTSARNTRGTCSSVSTRSAIVFTNGTQTTPSLCGTSEGRGATFTEPETCAWVKPEACSTRRWVDMEQLRTTSEDRRSREQRRDREPPAGATNEGWGSRPRHRRPAHSQEQHRTARSTFAVDDSAETFAPYPRLTSRWRASCTVSSEEGEEHGQYRAVSRTTSEQVRLRGISPRNWEARRSRSIAPSTSRAHTELRGGVHPAGLRQGASDDFPGAIRTSRSPWR